MAHMGALQMRFTAVSVPTKWQRFEKGIMAGCTISVALFIAAMNLLLTAGAQLNTWLKAVEHSQLLRRFEVWCFQYGIIPGCNGPSYFMNFPCPKWKEWKDCAASSCGNGWETPHPSAQSTCTARPLSFFCQFHQWWWSLKPPRQGQSVHSFHLRTGK